MLDLTQIKIAYFDVTLPNGDILKLKKPTHSMMQQVIRMQNKETNEEKQLKNLHEFVLMLINNNKEGNKYTIKDVESMFEIDLINVLIEHYMKFVTEVSNNPN